MSTLQVVIGYPNISFLRNICNLYAGVPLDKLKEAFKVCAIMTSPAEENVEFIICGQILFNDIELLSVSNPDLYEKYYKVYKELNSIHGNEFMDLVVTKDTDSITESLVDALNFLMDTVYKTSEITVEFIDCNKGEYTFLSEYPNLIYSAIQEHFNIKEQKFHLAGRVITIKKRSEENDNAN